MNKDEELQRFKKRIATLEAELEEWKRLYLKAGKRLEQTWSHARKLCDTENKDLREALKRLLECSEGNYVEHWDHANHVLINADEKAQEEWDEFISQFIGGE